jgi:hypothetical protein
MEDAGIFFGDVEYFTAIWYSLWPFCNVVVIWYIFPRSGILCQEKSSGSPDRKRNAPARHLRLTRRGKSLYYFKSPVWNIYFPSTYKQTCKNLFCSEETDHLGIVSACWATYGSWDRIPPGYIVVAFHFRKRKKKRDRHQRYLRMIGIKDIYLWSAYLPQSDSSPLSRLPDFS